MFYAADNMVRRHLQNDLISESRSKSPNTKITVRWNFTYCKLYFYEWQMKHNSFSKHIQINETSYIFWSNKCNFCSVPWWYRRFLDGQVIHSNTGCQWRLLFQKHSCGTDRSKFNESKILNKWQNMLHLIKLMFFIGCSAICDSRAGVPVYSVE